MNREFQNILGFVIFGSYSLGLIFFPKYYVKVLSWLTRKNLQYDYKGPRVAGIIFFVLVCILFFAIAGNEAASG